MKHDSKIIVATGMRCGSTWLSYATAKLFGQKPHYVSGENIGARLDQPSSSAALNTILREIDRRPEKVIKMHHLGPGDWESVLRSRSDWRILSIRRWIPDTVVSYGYYVRDFRRSKGITLSGEYQALVEQHGDLPDHEFLDQFCQCDETRRFIERQAAFERAKDLKRLPIIDLTYESLFSADRKRILSDLAGWVNGSDSMPGPSIRDGRSDDHHRSGALYQSRSLLSVERINWIKSIVREANR